VAAVRELNPQYLRLATPPGVSSVVRIPPGRGPTTLAAFEMLPPARRITFLEHTVVKGQTLSGIASRYGVSTRLVVEANPRLRGRKLRPGQRVIVPTGGAISTSVARRMADPVEPATSSPTGFHRVRRGETLSGLAAEYGVTVRQLREWNALGANGMVRSGQRIRVAAPAPGRPPATAHPTTALSASARQHQVRRGETLTGLAKRYGVSVQALREANGLSSGEALRAGVTLKIPG
jgi:LysM repeat protein